MIVVERTEHDVLALATVESSGDVWDGGDWVGKRVAKPWGEETEVSRDGLVSVTRLTLHAGGETSMHCHPGKVALLLLAEGHCELESLRVIYKLKPGDMVRIERGAFHRLRTQGGAIVVEVESPANKQNIVRLADRYGRGQGYAHAAR